MCLGRDVETKAGFLGQGFHSPEPFLLFVLLVAFSPHAPTLSSQRGRQHSESSGQAEHRKKSTPSEGLLLAAS